MPFPSTYPRSSRRKKILTWHVHGNYLFYLTQAEHDFYLPVKEGKPEGYGGRAGTLPWGDNVFEVAVEDVRNCAFDAILYQSTRNYLIDRQEILSEEQRALPQIYLEHDPPREHPTDTHHTVDDPNMLLVHVTQFNRWMWDNNRTPVTVIEHGVLVPEGVRYSGGKERGIVVVNNLLRRGRRTGADIFEYTRQKTALDLVGMDAASAGGLGEIPYLELLPLEAQYRFFFNPIRYTSLGLAVCEAMMIGMPIIGLATTEMAAVIENGVNGYADTNVDQLIEWMNQLMQDRAAAQELSRGAKQYAMDHFQINRFKQDWDTVFAQV